MSGRRRRGGGAAAPAPEAAREPAAAAAWAVAATLLAALVLVDPGAEEAFESVKRAAVAAGAALAALLLARRARPDAAPAGAAIRGARAAAAVLAAVALAAVALAALLAPARAAALAALRPVLVGGLLVAVGAALDLGASGGRLVIGAGLAGCAANALLALLQAAGAWQPFAVEALAGRTGAFGLLGNEGVLACALALGTVAASSVALAAGSRPAKALAAATGALCVGGLLATRNLTGLLALAAGAATLLLLARGRRAALPLAAGAALVAVAALAAPATRGRIGAAAGAALEGRWDDALSARFGPWAAAAAMVGERPWLGAGPGAYAAGYVPHRLAAELRLRRRFSPPAPATAFGEAHAEPLDAAVAAGVPAAVAAVGALALLLTLLARAGSDPANAHRSEAALLAALLVAGAVASLTWFPFQRAATAVPLLLAAGRGWRITGGGGGRAVVARWSRPAAVAVACLALLGAGLELRRHGAERRLRGAVSLLGSPGRPTAALERAAAQGRELAGALPGDPRPRQLAAAALLLARRPAEALAAYREANAVGERAENDLNIGRAFAILDRREEAFAAFVRAAWIAPHLVPQMPEAARELVLAETARLEALLRAGRLAAPPAPP